MCVHFFGSIIELYNFSEINFFVTRDFNDGDSEKKWGMLFFVLVGVQEKSNKYFNKKKKRKNEVVIGI